MRQRSGMPFDTMPAEQRLGRIMELLGKAVLLAEASRMIQSGPALDASRANDARGTQIDHRILSYLSVSREATPVVIRAALGLSRTSAYRSFSRLENAGFIVGRGRARALVYRLSRSEPPPDKIALN